MKKFLSIILSVMMVASVVCISAVPAMAKTYGSMEGTTASKNVTVEVNGQGTGDITYKEDAKDKNTITFTYDGEGDVIDWKFDGLVEGVDYEIISIDGNTITVKFKDGVSDIKVNAVTEEPNDEPDVPSEPTTKPTTAKPDKGDTSPDTGASLAGVAVAGAGAAMLIALKKRDND